MSCLCCRPAHSNAPQGGNNCSYLADRRWQQVWIFNIFSVQSHLLRSTVQEKDPEFYRFLIEEVAMNPGKFVFLWIQQGLRFGLACTVRNILQPHAHYIVEWSLVILLSSQQIFRVQFDADRTSNCSTLLPTQTQKVTRMTRWGIHWNNAKRTSTSIAIVARRPACCDFI